MTVVVVVVAAVAAIIIAIVIIIIIVGSSHRIHGPAGFSIDRTVPANHMQTYSHDDSCCSLSIYLCLSHTSWTIESRLFNARENNMLLVQFPIVIFAFLIAT